MLPTRFITHCILALATLSAAAQQVHVPTPSTWKLNAAKSDPAGPLSQLTSYTLTFLSDTPEKLSYRAVWTDANGKTVSSGYDGPEDGTLRPLLGSKDRASFTPGGMGHFVDADGTTSDAQLSLSPDGKSITMTLSFKGTGRIRRALKSNLRPHQIARP